MEKMARRENGRGNGDDEKEKGEGKERLAGWKKERRHLMKEVL
jgi:hypothetical protein